MGTTIDARVKQKTGTAADFAGYTLLEGEIALVRTSANGLVWNFKVGPGNFDSLDWSLQNPGAAQKADTSTVFPVGVPGLYIPTEDGTYEGVTVDLSSGYTQLIWDGANLVDAVFPIDLSGYATASQVEQLENIIDGGTSVFGPTDELITYTEAYTGAGSTRINNMVVEVDSVVNKIRFICRRAGTVSIRFFRFNEDGTTIYAYSALSFAATVGLMEYTAGIDFDDITMRKGDMYGTYASNSIGSVGYKSKTNASYSITGSVGGTPFNWSDATLNNTEWGVVLDVEAIGLKDQVPELNQVVFSETDPILKESSLDTDSGSITGINGIPIAGAAPTVQPVDRKATFSIVFDDGNASDLDVADKLDEYGWKCGFALKSGSFNAARYQALQDRGFEILSHSVNHEHFDETSTYDDAQAEAEMKNSLATLIAAGLSVTGWVTPYSVMKPEWIPLVRKYYQYGYTVGFGTVTPVNEGDCYHTFWEELRELKRVSMESSTEADILSAIDAVVAAGGFCIFYAHVYPDTLTETEFTNILNHLKTYVDAGQADVLKPIDAVNKYYALGHKDVLDLYNQLNP